MFQIMNPGGWQKVFQYKGKKAISNLSYSNLFLKSHNLAWFLLEIFFFTSHTKHCRGTSNNKLNYITGGECGFRLSLYTSGRKENHKFFEGSMVAGGHFLKSYSHSVRFHPHLCLLGSRYPRT